MSELNSRGQEFLNLDYQYTGTVSPGDTGLKVTVAQYILSVLSQFYYTIPDVNIDGIYGTDSENAVKAFQKTFDLPVTGVITAGVWDQMYKAFVGINETLTDKRYINELNNILNGNPQKSARDLRIGDSDFE